MAADAGAACAADADCAVRYLGRCGLDGLDCFSVHYNQSLPTKPLDDALAAYGTGCMRMHQCRCSEPDTSVCRAGRCQRP